MSSEAVLLVLFGMLAVLAAGIMYGMFRVAPSAQFEVSRLYFAAGVLAFLAFIFIAAMIFYAYGPPVPGGVESAGKTIFDACVKTLPPIATLVIGFYFGSQTGRSSANPPKP
jgi:heme A synthase